MNRLLIPSPFTCQGEGDDSLVGFQGKICKRFIYLLSIYLFIYFLVPGQIKFSIVCIFVGFFLHDFLIKGMCEVFMVCY